MAFAVLSEKEVIVAAGDKIVAISRVPGTGSIHHCRDFYVADPPPPQDDEDTEELTDNARAAAAKARGTRFCGVAVRGDGQLVRVTSDCGQHAVWELRPSPMDRPAHVSAAAAAPISMAPAVPLPTVPVSAPADATPGVMSAAAAAAAASALEVPSSAAWTCTLVAGGNREFNSRIKTMEGTAKDMSLWRPTSCCFCLDSFVFCHTGSGSIMLMSDLHLYVTEVIPVMRKMVEAAGLSDIDADNAVTFHGALAKLRQVLGLFDSIQHENAAITGRKGGQGNDGCWSNNLRRALKTLIGSLEWLLNSWYERGVPEDVVLAQRIKALLTLCVESFFPTMRDVKNSGGSNPYALDCAQHRELVILERAKATIGILKLGWCYYMGDSKHYIPTESASVELIHMRRKQSSPSTGALMAPGDRKECLEVLRK